MRKFILPGSPQGGFDLWLFDKEVKDKLVELDEKNTHISYLFIWLGYEYVNVPYTRNKREIGKSKWTLNKRIKSFIDSILAFSFLPVRAISSIGLLFGAFTLLYGGYIVYEKITGGLEAEVEGWASLMVVLLLVSSFQMVAMGVLGEYIWRILDNSQKRPNFVIDKVVEETVVEETVVGNE